MTHHSVMLLAASAFVLLHDAAAAATASNRTKDRSTSTTKCLGYATCPSFPEPYATDNYPLTYDYKGTFPKDFAFGLGTAAYQIEGGYRQDGRGASFWDTFVGADTVGMPGAICTATPCPVSEGMVAKGATGNVAANHYNLFKDDIALMKDMGLPYYRFSISWPRLIPLGTGAVNSKAVDFYNNLINGLVAAGIQPFVTLYHWDLPQALMLPPYDGNVSETSFGNMGWFSVDAEGEPNGGDTIVPAYVAYVDACFRLFGDRVKHWLTFNEAWTFIWQGMLMFPCRLRHFAHVNASDELHPSPLVALFGTPPPSPTN